MDKGHPPQKSLPNDGEDDDDDESPFVLWGTNDQQQNCLLGKTTTLWTKEFSSIFCGLGVGFQKTLQKTAPNFFVCVCGKRKTDDSQSVSSIWLSFLTQRPTYVP